MISILCSVGRHKWIGCECINCHKTKEHDWDGCKCKRCGAVREQEHQWGDEKCSICGRLLPASVWITRLTKKGDYEEIAKILGVYSWKTSDEKNTKERQELARDALISAGDMGMAAACNVLSKNPDNNEKLIRLLAGSSYSPAAEILVANFEKVGYGNSSTTVEIANFIYRVKAKYLASQFVPYLQHENEYIRYSAAYALALISDPKFEEALIEALSKYPTSVKGGLENADNAFSKSILSKFEEITEKDKPSHKTLTESELLLELIKFSKETPNKISEQQELAVRKIGEELFRRGNELLMREVLKQVQNYRRIETIWNGIGSWQG